MDLADETKGHTVESNDQESILAAVKSPNKKHSEFNIQFNKKTMQHILIYIVYLQVLC